MKQKKLTKEQKLLLRCYEVLRTTPTRKWMQLYKEVQAYLDKRDLRETSHKTTTSRTPTRTYP